MEFVLNGSIAQIQSELEEFAELDAMVKKSLNRKDRVTTIRAKVEDAINKSMQVRAKTPDKSSLFIDSPVKQEP